jgi:peptide/nickel transport system permease protein
MRARRLLRELLRSGPGRLGLVLFAILTITAMWVVATFPLDFGPARWSNPEAWADYPKAAPPAWTALLEGDSAPEHRVLSTTRPAEARTTGAAQIRTYELPFTYRQDEPPTFLSFNLGPVTFHGRPPSYSVSLVRPDGQTVPLYRDVVRGPRPGEAAPYVRNANEPFRVLLSGEDLPVQSAVKLYAATYATTVDPASIAGRPERALFAVPDGSGGFTPLHGDYRIEVRMAVADPQDVIGPVGAVVGGGVYGLLGTDTQGRDLAQGLLFGLPIALIIGMAAAVVATGLGTGLGLLSGYMGGRVDLLIQRTADIINNVPLLPLLIFLVFVLGSQLWLILLVLVLFSWPGLAIMVRSMVLGLTGGHEIEAARALGASHRHILVRHVFPHTAPFVFTQLIFFVPAAILAEAGLSFLGLGDPSLPTWGQMLEEGFRTGAVFLGYWWWVVSPGVMIVITAVTFMLLAVAMEPIVDPRLRRR